MNETQVHTNQLIHETSPYLLQHAHNPVDWYSWNDRSLGLSRKEDMPIFLSIGYSACHWCHVMEKESFEDEETASILNQNFISIKVDREENPDLDSTYMTAVQHMTGQGGWPLTVFLTPDLKPFFGGTYFPPTDAYGLIGFKTLLLRIAKAWKEMKDSMIKNSEMVLDSIRKSETDETVPGQMPTHSMLKNALEKIEELFDNQFGGFGTAPKFPQAPVLSFLLGQYSSKKESAYLTMTELTLKNMAMGGIYDHIGGGFHRYATDRKWLVPHFEKMLYDNALLSSIYLHAFQATKKPLYKEIAVDTLNYVLRDMTNSTGGFHSSQDADSEGKEGAFYVWDYNEFVDLLGEEKGSIAADYYSILSQGNFDAREPHLEGKNIPHITKSKEAIAKKHSIPIHELEKVINESHTKLYAHRSKRAPPGKDDKLITSWNSLMISSLTHGYCILEEKQYLDAAVKAANFISSTLFRENTLYRIYRNGTVKQAGFLDDYAYFCSALIDLYESSFETDWLHRARVIADSMIRDFYDPQGHGFYFTATCHDNPVSRSKSVSDAALPSGNAIAAQVLLRCAKLFDNKEYFKKAEELLVRFSGQVTTSPLISATLLTAEDFYLNPPREIALIGNAESPDTCAMLRTIHSQFIPNKVIAFVDPQSQSAFDIVSKIPLLKAKPMISDRTTAYVCSNFSCKNPVTTSEGLIEQLTSSEGE
ncbi:MAG: DUF255 domain-containing protein [Chitinivibrionales bacterium]|nr:DUF255 domain-containing protein [Chitinivibrionales bacterium]